MFNYIFLMVLSVLSFACAMLGVAWVGGSFGALMFGVGLLGLLVPAFIVGKL